MPASAIFFIGLWVLNDTQSDLLFGVLGPVEMVHLLTIKTSPHELEKDEEHTFLISLLVIVSEEAREGEAKVRHLNTWLHCPASLRAMEAPALGTLPRVALFSAKATVSLSVQSREVTKLA